jgi:hypothetical protein
VVTAGDARGFFEHRGYRVAAHLLCQTLYSTFHSSWAWER